MATAADHIRRPGRERMQERIISAALECFRRSGVGDTRMEEIADEAGLQRPNLYRYFPSKEALIADVIVREMRVTHVARHRQLPVRGPAAKLLTEALVVGLEIAREDELIAFNLSRGAIDITVDLLATDPAVFAAEEEYWGPLIRHGRARGEIRDDLTDEEIIRWFLYQQFMFLERPQFSAGPGGVRRWVERFVVPAVISPSSRRSSRQPPADEPAADATSASARRAGRAPAPPARS